MSIFISSNEYLNINNAEKINYQYGDKTYPLFVKKEYYTDILPLLEKLSELITKCDISYTVDINSIKFILDIFYLDKQSDGDDNHNNKINEILINIENILIK